MKQQMSLRKWTKTRPPVVAEVCNNHQQQPSSSSGATNGGIFSMFDDDFDDSALDKFVRTTNIDEPSTSSIDSGSKQRSSKTTCDNGWEEYVPGFNVDAGQHWFYPINYSKRAYQYSMVETALYNNTLVALPTGLGKTFIAAVVMYNFYRWYPSGKILFVAPTRPLVEQQIEACFNIVGIPQRDMCTMSGKKTQQARVVDWKTHRVFFLTPQVCCAGVGSYLCYQTLTSDLDRMVCDSKNIKCLVVDEAHKATGNYAYCVAIRRLIEDGAIFRVLALSATPGNNIDHVQQVVTNLLISRFEIRTEQSADVRPYVFVRDTQKIVVRLDGDILRLKNLFIQGLQPMIDELRQQNAIDTNNVEDYSLFKIKMASDRIDQLQLPQHIKARLKRACTLLQSLYHSFDLLVRHGMRALHRHMKEVVTTNHLLRSTIDRIDSFKDIWNYLCEHYDGLTNVARTTSIIDQLLIQSDRTSTSTVAQSPIDERVLNSHPKITHLRDILIAHFKSSTKSTRAIVFSSYRDSVDEITDFLRRLSPLIRPAEFKGQTGRRSGQHQPPSVDVKKKRGVGGQKEQLEVLSSFHSGKYNVLVSTCVGEEGLDIGQVDLIVCYDTNSSGIRHIQRMGRTGRQRQGRIVFLLTEKWEERNYANAERKNNLVHKAIITKADNKFDFYRSSPRMIPHGLTPKPLDVRLDSHPQFQRDNGRKRSHENTPMNIRRLLLASPYLDDEQMADFDQRYRLTDGYIPQRKRDARMLSMGDQPDVSNRFDLGAYILWQDTLQPTSFVDHSDMCIRFVRTIAGTDSIVPNNNRMVTTTPSMSMLTKSVVPADRNNNDNNNAISTTTKVVKSDKSTRKRSIAVKRKCHNKRKSTSSSDCDVHIVASRRAPVTACDFASIYTQNDDDRYRLKIEYLDNLRQRLNEQCDRVDWRAYDIDDSFESELLLGEDVDRIGEFSTANCVQEELAKSGGGLSNDEYRIRQTTPIRQVVQSTVITVDDVVPETP